MLYGDNHFTIKNKFLIFGTADPNLVFDILKRHKICVWSDLKQCYDVIENKNDIHKVSFSNAKAELDIDDKLIAYSGTEYGQGVVIGLDLNENVLENRSLGQIRDELVQIMREHGAYVTSSDLNIMYGVCSE